MNRSYSKTNFEEFITNNIDKIKKAAIGKVIAIYDNYFSYQLSGYKLTKIEIVSKGEKIKEHANNTYEAVLHEYTRTEETNICIETHAEFRRNCLLQIFKREDLLGGLIRNTIQSIQPYHDLLSVNKIEWSVNPHARGQNLIISPFKQKQESEKIRGEYRELILHKKKDALKSAILKNNIESLVTHKMSQFIIKNSTNKIPKERDQILEAYSEMIAEAILEDNNN